jgi:HPr kinase/phosphorylase
MLPFFRAESTLVRHVSLVQLYEDNREKLLLNWASSHQTDRRIEIKGSNNYGADLVGHINIIHPERLQVMGLAEYEWAMRMAERASGRCSPICSPPSRRRSSSPTA